MQTGDNDRDTPLHLCETVECATLLLEAGADLNARNADGRTVRICVYEWVCRLVAWTTRLTCVLWRVYLLACAQPYDVAIQDENEELMAMYADRGADKSDTAMADEDTSAWDGENEATSAPC